VTNTGTMIDCTGANLSGLLSALGSNYPDTIASYVTGTDGIAATAAQFADLSGKVGVFRYDQSPSLSAFADGGADGADIENGAGTVVAAVEAAKAREARGWYSWFYISNADLAAAREAVAGASLQKIQFGVANWDLNQAEAKAFLAANPDVAYVQWASPSSNPSTICPGTSRTLAQLNVDLNVTLPGWFVKVSNTVPPVKTTSGIVVMSDLSTVKVTSTDGKNWVGLRSKRT
jgi:hypothetical protein